MSKCEGTERGSDSDEEMTVDVDGGEESPSDDAHLEEIPDGAGCTGIWEYLSEKREADDD